MSGVQPQGVSEASSLPPESRWIFADALAQTVRVEGADISYRLWDAAGPDAPALLFLHGFRAHSRWWDHIIPSFIQDYRVATMDFSGLGDSAWRERYTARTFATEVLAVLASTKLAPATIIGHSFGGSPGLIASTIAPEAVSRVILIDSFLILKGVPEPDGTDLVAPSSNKRIYATQSDMLRNYRLLPRSGPVPAEILDHVALHSGRLWPEGWAWKFDGSFEPQLISDPHRLDAKPVTVPVDYIFGESSKIVSPALADRIESLLPTCSKPIMMPHCDHHILLEQPMALIAVLKALLGRDPTPPNTIENFNQVSLQLDDALASQTVSVATR